MLYYIKKLYNKILLYISIYMFLKARIQRPIAHRPIRRLACRLGCPPTTRPNGTSAVGWPIRPIQRPMAQPPIRRLKCRLGCLPSAHSNKMQAVDLIDGPITTPPSSPSNGCGQPRLRAYPPCKLAYKREGDHQSPHFYHSTRRFHRVCSGFSFDFHFVLFEN